ncbi:hypothetical protein LSAT2_012126 [Lamellibrachia satsuma]|nr:hypothetical protein LSAT2_012126 [Lamellibrachia satsuma]
MRSSVRDEGQHINGQVLLGDCVYNRHESSIFHCRMECGLLGSSVERFISWPLAVLTERYLFMLERGPHPCC